LHQIHFAEALLRKQDNAIKQQEVQAQFRRVTSRDYELLGLGVLAMTALLVGMLAFAATQNQTAFASSLPQLVVGLVALLVLLNAYVVSQKRTLHRATDLLIQQVASESLVQKYSFIDIPTQLFTREYLDHAMAHELMRVHQFGTPLTFLLIRIHVPRSQTGDLIPEAAQILRSTFRGSDTLLRFDHRDFIVMLSETAEQGAHVALRRLTNNVERWNVTTTLAVELTFSYVLRPFSSGKGPVGYIEELGRAFAAMDESSHEPPNAGTRSFIPLRSVVPPVLPIVH
jgi:GGDEF domain-containing protein